jgi:hypothetical protein
MLAHVAVSYVGEFLPEEFLLGRRDCQNRDMAEEMNGDGAERVQQVSAYSGRVRQPDITAYRELLERWGVWGFRPWRRLAALVPLLVPAFLLLRVGAVVHWQRHDTWLAIASLDLNSWLQVAVGSYCAWLPWSGYVTTALLMVYVAMSVRVLCAARLVKRKRGREFGVETVADGLGVLFYYLMPAAAVALFVLLNMKIGDGRGLVVVAGATVAGVVLGVLNFLAQGRSKVTVLQFVQQVPLKPLPRVEGPTTAAELVSVTTGADTPLVLRELDEDTLMYCNTDDLLQRIFQQKLRPCDEGPDFWHDVPVVNADVLVSDLQDAIKKRKVSPVCAVYQDGELHELYGTPRGHAMLGTSSSAESAFGTIWLMSILLLLVAVFAAVGSSTPWQPRQCLDIGTGSPTYGYALADTGRGVLVVIDEPRRSVLIDDVHNLSDDKCGGG